MIERKIIYCFSRSIIILKENSLFGAIKLTKNANTNKYRYSGYGIGLDTRGSFSLADGSGSGRNVIVIGVDMSSSGHLILRKNIS